MLKKELIPIFKAAKPVLKNQYMDIKVATAQKRGHLIIVTPRIIGNAPQRNKIRRRIKAIFHENKLLQADTAWIFFIKKEGVSLEFSELLNLVVNTVLQH